MKKLIIFLIVAAAAIVLFVVFKGGNSGPIQNDGQNEASVEEKELKVGTGIGDVAPEFEARTYDGETVKLSDYKGKPVFVNFWAAWCPFCVDELPLMADVQNKHGDSYVTLAVNRGESLETAKKFSDELDVTGTMIFLLNEKDDIYQRYGGFAMPYSLFLNEEGVIVDVKRGPLTPKELEQKINFLLTIN